MVFRRFSLIVLLRTIALCVSAFVLIYLLAQTAFIATPFIVALIIVAQMYLSSITCKRQTETSQNFLTR